MTREAISELLTRMSASCAKEPTALQRSVLMESMIDNSLTPAEIKRGYIAVRDAAKPWWPTPGEFLALARPPVSSAVVESEASRLFDLIRENTGMRFGKYNPESGVIRERRLIEDVLGRAAGLAFVAAGGSQAFASMTEKSEPWVRKAFSEAYEDARADYGAPVTLDPARLLPAAPAPAKALTGAVEPSEQEKKFRELVLGFRSPAAAGLNQKAADERLRILREQARELTSGDAA
jgi:hypothetical protein